MGEAAHSIVPVLTPSEAATVISNFGGGVTVERAIIFGAEGERHLWLIRWFSHSLDPYDDAELCALASRALADRDELANLKGAKR